MKIERPRRDAGRDVEHERLVTTQKVTTKEIRPPGGGVKNGHFSIIWRFWRFRGPESEMRSRGHENDDRGSDELHDRESDDEVICHVTKMMMRSSVMKVGVWR